MKSTKKTERSFSQKYSNGKRN